LPTPCRRNRHAAAAVDDDRGHAHETHEELTVKPTYWKTWIPAVWLLPIALTMSSDAAGQSSSQYGDPRARRPLTLADCSWTFDPPPEPKQIKLHDQITVIVNEKWVVTSEGEMDRRKKTSANATVKDWVLLKKFSLIPDPQSAGDPKISTALENKYQAKSDLEERSSMTFKIACEVADKRPNGLLVIEGRRKVGNNHDSWEQCLTGVVRPEDVLPNNTVLSENVAELRIFKRESGHVRDGYRRGWLLEWLDKYQLF